MQNEGLQANPASPEFEYVAECSCIIPRGKSVFEYDGRTYCAECFTSRMQIIAEAILNGAKPEQIAGWVGAEISEA